MNKILKSLLLLFLIFPAIHIHAQRKELRQKVGKPHEIRNWKFGWHYKYVSSFVYEGQTHVLAVKSKYWFFENYHPSAELFTLDNDANVESVAELDLSPENTLPSYLEMIQMDEYVFVFYTIGNTKTKKQQIFCTRYSLIDKKSRFIRIAEADYKSNIGLKLITNEKKDRIAVIIGEYFYTGRKKSKKSKNQLDYVVLDAEMEVLSFGSRIKIGSSTDETIEKFYLTPDDNIMVITKKEILAKSQKKGLFKQEPLNLGSKYSLKFLRDGQIASLDIGDNQILRGAVGLYVNDSVFRLFNYYAGKDLATKGIIQTDVDVSSFTILNTVASTFEGAISEPLEVQVEDEMEPEEPAKNKKQSQKQRNKTDRTNKATFDNLFLMQSAHRLSSGQVVVFGEGFKIIIERVSERGKADRITYHYIYGPGALSLIDTTGEIINNALANYSMDFTNRNPGYGAIATALNNGGFVVANANSYTTIDFRKKNYKMKEFKIDESESRRRRGGNTVLTVNESLVIIKRKKKSVTFSLLAL